MNNSLIGRRIVSAWTGFLDLVKLLPIIKEHRSDPKKFWIKYKKGICNDLKKKYTKTEKPDIEILIPIHHNSDDLPLLLYGLSRQKVESNTAIGLTVLMHNNQNIKKWDMYDDGSWKIIRDLLRNNVPIKVISLTDPLLTGPYLAWQYLIAKSSGNIIAILDADCLPPSEWLSRITNSLRHNRHIRLTGGVRIEMSDYFPFNFTTRMYYAITALIHIVNPAKPNLPQMKAFQGGNAAYNKKLVYPTFKKVLGSPEGDSVFAWIMLNKYGESSFSFTDAPVFCKITNPKRISLNTVIVKIQRVLQSYLPRRLTSKFRCNKPSYNNIITNIHIYSHWFKPIINRYIAKEAVTSEEVINIFNQTAIDQRFHQNPYVCRFIKYLHDNHFEVNNNQQLFELYLSIAEHCHRPTLTDHLNSPLKIKHHVFFSKQPIRQHL